MNECYKQWKCKQVFSLFNQTNASAWWKNEMKKKELPSQMGNGMHKRWSLIMMLCDDEEYQIRYSFDQFLHIISMLLLIVLHLFTFLEKKKKQIEPIWIRFLFSQISAKCKWLVGWLVGRCGRHSTYRAHAVRSQTLHANWFSFM